MSIVTKKDLHTPFSSHTIEKILGAFQRQKSVQAVAATLANDPISGGPADHAGKPRSIFVVLEELPAAGESMVIDVSVGATSLLAAPFTVDATTATSKYIELPLSASGQINIGDLVEVDRTYVAGGGPAMTRSTVGVEWS